MPNGLFIETGPNTGAETEQETTTQTTTGITLKYESRKNATIKDLQARRPNKNQQRKPLRVNMKAEKNATIKNVQAQRPNKKQQRKGCYFLAGFCCKNM